MASLLLLVFGVREDIPNVNYLPAVFDHGDEPVLVAADSEYGEQSRCVGVPKVFSGILKAGPGCTLGDEIPMHQRLQSVLVHSRELGYCRFADDPHFCKSPKWELFVKDT
jgi:hypothetical protein